MIPNIWEARESWEALIAWATCESLITEASKDSRDSKIFEKLENHEKLW